MLRSDDGQIVLDFYEDNVGTDIDNPSNVGIHDFAHRYLWNPAAVDQLLAVEELERLNANVVDLSEEGTVAWPMPDRQGSIRDVASYDAQSDTTTLTSHIVYDSFGNVVLHEDGSQSLLATFEIIFGHQGTLFSTETGLNYHRARWLDASTGRWINEDPIGFAGEDYNLNRTMGNAMTIYVDRDGMEKSFLDKVDYYLGISYLFSTTAPVGQKARDAGGRRAKVDPIAKDYLDGVADTSKGYFIDAPTEIVLGGYQMVRHPISTAQGLGQAICSPIDTGLAIKDAYVTTWNSGNRGKGKIAFEIVTIVLGPTKAAKASKLGKLENDSRITSAICYTARRLSSGVLR